MKAKNSALIIVTAFALIGHATGASAQVNCNVLPHGQGRSNCYGQQAHIYRQQSQAYYGIAQQQYRQHQQIGQALRYAPYGQYTAPAWNAPRYIYDRYGRR